MIVGEDVSILVKDDARAQTLLTKVAFTARTAFRGTLEEVVKKVVKRRIFLRMGVAAADPHCRFGINVYHRIFYMVGNLGERVGEFNRRGQRKRLGIRAAAWTFGRPHTMRNHRADQNSDPQGYGNYYRGQNPTTTITHLDLSRSSRFSPAQSS